MICREAQELIHAYVDGELDLVRNLEMERHFHDCPACSAAYEKLRVMRSAIASNAPYFRPPDSFEARLRARLHEARETPAALRRMMPAWQWAAIAAAVLVAAASVTVLIRRPAGEQLIAQQVVAGHVRSLMAAHLTDVPSSDQHTVKPWFNGRLDFSPPVHDFADRGFPLAGGRLDYIDDRPVAALVYRSRLHVINLFIWPARGLSNSTVREADRQGYHLLHWDNGGMVYWAVSDLNTAELKQFADLVKAF